MRNTSTLGVSPSELSDPTVIHDVRGELGLGRICYGGAALYPGQPNAMEAKFRIARLLVPSTVSIASGRTPVLHESPCPGTCVHAVMCIIAARIDQTSGGER